MYKKRKEIQAALIPSEIVMNNHYNHNFPTDFGRAIMQNDVLVFKECVEESLGVINEEKLQLNNLDAFLLNIILDYLKKNEITNDKKEMYISLPQLSSSFPILVTYHLVFNDLANRLMQNNNLFSNFKKNEGILLISHNIDLLRHVWDTTLNNIFLRKYFPTYILKGKKLKIFNFKSNTKDIKFNDDGTLPWIGFYRAHRKDLVDSLERKPKVIILDLIPLYHRKRATELIKWAKSMADNVIVVLPANDMNLKYSIQDHSMHYLINQSTARILEKILPFATSNLLYPSWGTAKSLKYLQPKNLNFEIREYAKVDKKIVELLGQYDKALNDCKKMNGILPEKYWKIDSLKMHMCNLIVPLSIFEQEKRQEKLFNIFDLFINYKSIPPQDSEEYSLESNLAHHLYFAFEELYNALFENEYTFRGKLLIDSLKSLEFSKGLILILILDKYEQKIAENYLSSLVEKEFKVITYKEFTSMQLKNEYPIFDTLFLTTPFPNKYISGLNINNSNIICISIFNESSKYEKQFENIFNNKKDNANFSRVLSKNHSINIKDIEFTNRFYKFNFVKNSEFKLSNNEEELQVIENIPLTIFDDVRLLELLKSNRQYHLKVKDLVEMKDKQEKNSSTIAQLIEIEDIEGNRERLFIPIDDLVSIQKSNKELIETIEVSKINVNDLWIRVNNDQRKDLFQEILNVASSTMIMRWISEGLAIWQDILKNVWKKFYNGQRYKKEVYEDIRRNLNLNGGNISSYYTVSNWFKNINVVRDEENLKALIKISDKSELVDSMRVVLSSISELRSIHIQLGRAISKIINIQSKKLIDYENMDEWITIGENIVIPTEDVSSLIDIVKVVNINVADRVFIPNELIYQNISEEIMFGIIKTFKYQEESFDDEFITESN